MNVDEARTICNRFATEHKVIFMEEGECGFGRECVGFLAADSKYVDYCPERAIMSDTDINIQGYEPIPEFNQVETRPPESVDRAYHKHDCMAVLGRDDESIIQLATWVQHIESYGLPVKIEQYETGLKGMQALLGGTKTHAIRLVK